MTDAPPPTNSSYRARVLVAEDDGPSGLFFTTAFDHMHCRVDLATTGQQALQLSRAHRYDLLVLDRRMPDFGATHILSALRADPVAASHASPALATSAELDTAERQHFRQIGFADALLKPMSLDALKGAAEACLPGKPEIPPEAMLDDATALGNSGSAESVAALRKLFIHELSRLAREVDHDACQGEELSERLHRLLASCGFCGANALAEATRKLKRQLDAHAPVACGDLQHFRDVLSATLEALTRAEHA